MLMMAAMLASVRALCQATASARRPQVQIRRMPMISRPACQSISTEPPPARPVLLHRLAFIRPSSRRDVAFSRQLHHAFARGAAGIVKGMLAGLLTGLVLGAACGFLFVFVLLLAGSNGLSWSDRIVGGILFSTYATLIGAVIGAVPGLSVGGVVGAASALLRGGIAGRTAGLVLGAALSPLLLSGSLWENPVSQAVVAAVGALGGLRVAGVVAEQTRRLA
jgi:hypothetical protein